MKASGTPTKHWRDPEVDAAYDALLRGEHLPVTAVTLRAFARVAEQLPRKAP